jgi:hypothetical protein
MKTTLIQMKCPHCGRINQGASSHTDAVPKAGDWVVCWRCLMVCRIDEHSEGLTLRPLDLFETLAFLIADDFEQMRELVVNEAERRLARHQDC